MAPPESAEPYLTDRFRYINRLQSSALRQSHNLSEIHFEGDTPEPVLPDYVEDTAANTFCSDYFFQKDLPTIYYSGGTAGWDTEIWNGFTTIAEEYKIDWSPMK